MSSCVFGLNPPWWRGESSCCGPECTAEHRENVCRSPSSIAEKHPIFPRSFHRNMRATSELDAVGVLKADRHDSPPHSFIVMISRFMKAPPPKKKRCSQGVGVMHLLLWQLYLPRHPQSQERWDALQNKSFWSVIILGVGAGARSVVNDSINLLDKYQSPKSSHRCGCKRWCMNRWLLLPSAGGTGEV